MRPHYFGNAAFQADDAITSRLERIAHVPAYFIRGRLDIASPLRSAYEIALKLPNSTFDIVEAERTAPATTPLSVLSRYWIGSVHRTDPVSREGSFTGLRVPEPDRTIGSPHRRKQPSSHVERLSMSISFRTTVTV